MKRREFIKKAGLAAAAVAASPYILPSGRLFAATGSQMAAHVVFVLFAGGVRQQEAVLQRYLDDSQGVPIPGNIMYNLLNGAAPTSKIVYGTNGALTGDTPIPQILSSTLQAQGTLFPEVRSEVVGHYVGLNALVTGNYGFTQGLRQKPTYPTIFEYVRRHMGVKATKTWFIGNGIGNSIPLLNYSTHPDYGVEYAGNFIAPGTTFGGLGQKHIKNAKVYHPEEELGPMYKMKHFLDSVALTTGKDVPGVKNTDEEKNELKQFFQDLHQKVDNGTVAMPPVRDNGDLRTIGYACEVLRQFTPTITVINLSAADGCHSNFSGYLRALHRADHGVAHLWNYIQTQIPDMANNTAMIVVPEHGRNLDPNPILDENDWAAYDHSDENSKRVFGMMAGPGIPQNLSIGGPGNTKGDVTGAIPTIAEILGFKQDLQSNLLWQNSQSYFDLI